MYIVIKANCMKVDSNYAFKGFRGDRLLCYSNQLFISDNSALIKLILQLFQ